MIPRRRGTSSPLILILLLTCGSQAVGQAASSPRNVDALLQDLRRSGVDILYSSELVPSGLMEQEARADSPALERARLALADHGLELRAIATNRYVVVTRPKAEAVESPDEPMDEVSVYASRYAIGADLGGSQRLSATDIELVPGSHDDALRAVRSLPGIVSNASGRPYIRGSLSEDILVQYDGITLLDPFHLKNFQSLISAIDPAVIDHVEVFSGGFPVQYGRRSGGVIDIAAPSMAAGYENRASLSLLTAGIATIGRAESLPLEWVGSLRRSTLDLIEAVEDELGTPQFSDSLGRVRWFTDQGSWTAGWLLLDDRLRLGGQEEGEEETASARYRDEYVWLTRHHKFSDALDFRSSLVSTSADRGREGQLMRPGVASGQLDETRSFSGFDFTTDWSYRHNDSSTYTFGGAIGSTRAAYRYLRTSEFAPEVAAAFGRDISESLEYSANPKVVNLSVYAANRRRWNHFEAELGVRVDAQRYQRDGNHSQISPRMNLRYDLRDNFRLYASAGRFTQPQHVEEWRFEEAQQRPDAAQVSVHTILGAEYDLEGGGQIGVEAYSKLWITPVAYFDNLLDNFSLLPDLTPDRVRIVPLESEASGLELRAKRRFGERFTGWGTLAWARIADDFPGGGDVRRSWDQPLSLTAGLSWSNSRATISALGGWHRGWPSTPASFEPLQAGLRNSQRWGNYVSLDLRGSWTWQFAQGDLSVVLDVTNAINRGNECCLLLEQAQLPGTLQGEVDHWLPTIVNLGFTYRWRGRR